MPLSQTQEEVVATVKRLVSECLGVKIEEISLDASFTDDLGTDSLDIIDLVVAIKKEFGIKISDEDAEKIDTAQDVILYIVNHRVS